MCSNNPSHLFSSNLVFHFSSLYCCLLLGGGGLKVHIEGRFPVEEESAGHTLVKATFLWCLDHRWISVLTNSKEEALTMAFRGEQSTGENSLEDLTKAIIEDVQRLPGNDICCDCGSSGVCPVHRLACSASSLFLCSLQWGGCSTSLVCRPT